MEEQLRIAQTIVDESITIGLLGKLTRKGEVYTIMSSQIVYWVAVFFVVLYNILLTAITVFVMYVLIDSFLNKK